MAAGATGVTMKVEKAPEQTILSVDGLAFRLSISKDKLKSLRADLGTALAYLKKANRSQVKTPNKDFRIRDFGAASRAGSVSEFGGNGDRYQFTVRVPGDSESEPRWMVIREDQLVKLVGLLSE